MPSKLISFTIDILKYFSNQGNLEKQTHIKFCLRQRIHKFSKMEQVECYSALSQNKTRNR